MDDLSTKDDYWIYARAMNNRQRAEDLDDLNNEQAGREVGRIQRHLTRDEHSLEALKKKRERDAAFRSALAQMLRDDPLYADRYRKADAFLMKAETTTDQAIHVGSASLVAIEQTHNNLMAKANRLPDGTRVFRTEEGRVVDLEGNVIGASDVASIHWKSGAPSYEDIQKSRKALEKARSTVEELQSYRVDVLGTWRDRMDDEEDPIDPDAFDEMEDAIQRQAPEALRPALEGAWGAMSGLGEAVAGPSATKGQNSDRGSDVNLDITVPEL